MKRVMDIIHNALFGVAKDRRGGVATFLAATIIPLVAFSGLAVDTARGYLMKARLSYALDAAALAGARVMADPTERDATIARFFAANFPDGYMNSTIDGPHVTPDDVNKTITLDASANMGTSLMRIVGIDSMAVGASSQVTLSSRDLEVSVILDITGSMGGSKITDLISAATDLVNIVVQDDQTPHYSKAALIPFSQGVNVGGYAAQVRGAIPGSKAMTGASKTNPLVITAPNHGFANGDKVYITNVNGMTQLNSNYYTVANVTTNTFSLRNESNSSNINGTSGYSTYTSSGKVWCTYSGCEYFRFTNMNGSLTGLQISNCTSERIGAEAYTDAAPNTPALVGLNYPGSGNPCPSTGIVPLTANKTTLTDQIATLSSGGSTAGQVGMAWGWYMISPNFGYLWPDAENVPADYDTKDLLKVAVFMTDGEFNTIYNKGVIAQDSGSNSGGNTSKINQNGSNGANAFTQAQNICTAMKQKKIEIYTIGFEVGSFQPAIDFLSACATDTGHAYLAADGAELQTVFHTIAMNISRLRLSK